MPRLLPLLAFLAPLVLAGCSGNDVAVSGIEGTVTAGPTCPVEQNPPDPNCADRPLAVDLVLYRHATEEVVLRFASGEDGTYRVQVGPGSYAIRSEGGTPPTCATEDAIVVKAGSYTHRDVSCDTGIR